MSDVSRDDIVKISDDVAWKILTYLSTVTGPRAKLGLESNASDNFVAEDFEGKNSLIFKKSDSFGIFRISAFQKCKTLCAESTECWDIESTSLKPKYFLYIGSTSYG